jgi:hypothetical protein
VYDDPMGGSSPVATREHERPPRRPSRRQRGAMAGLVLIAIGVAALVATYVRSPLVALLFLPAMGVIFLLWGVASRQVGPLIPGGILTGIGVGVVLAQQMYAHADGQAQSGVILLSMGAGFLVITPLALLVARRRMWWPLLPGVILAAIGAALLVGGPALAVVQFLGAFWPVLLIAIGVYVLYQAARRREHA